MNMIGQEIPATTIETTEAKIEEKTMTGIGIATGETAAETVKENDQGARGHAHAKDGWMSTVEIVRNAHLALKAHNHKPQSQRR